MATKLEELINRLTKLFKQTNRNQKEIDQAIAEIKLQQKLEHEDYLARRLKPKPTNLTQSEGTKIEIPIE